MHAAGSYPDPAVPSKALVHQRAISLSWAVKVIVGQEFEECLELEWRIVRKKQTAEDLAPPHPKKYVVELVLNLREIESLPIKPPKDATVKKVEFGEKDMYACLQNMPVGRKFFISVVGTFEDGSQSRSPWVNARTLHPDTRDQFLGNLDPMDKPRLRCKECPCIGYVATKWNQFSGGDLRCRRCGCRCDSHVGVDVFEILKQRETKAVEMLKLETVEYLPKEAIKWDDRECSLWFLTRGQFHPRKSVAVGKVQLEETKVELGGPHGVSGKRGRVSVVTPTTESRQRFHERLWKSFEAQQWPDKELVVVETYAERPSEFFEQLAVSDERLTYVKFQAPADNDWTIGLKRNIGAHLATGEFIANFDDDDLYAPTYLSTMVGQLEHCKAQAVTLSSWYIFDVVANKWSFCDTIAWGLAQGLDEQAEEVKSWAYGYGFSYVNRRRASLEVPYDNKNMGEDYTFITQLQNQKGDRSVQLFHDAFGICAHVQHGYNTSKTFPIRDAPREEIAELDVVALARMLDLGIPNVSHRGSKAIDVQMANGKHNVKIVPGSTVEEFLRHLEKQVGCRCDDMKLHLVPPPGFTTQQARETIAAKVLGIEALMSFLAERKPGWNADAVASERNRLMLERVKSAMRKEDRIPLFITHVWLARPEDGAEAERQSAKALRLDVGLGTEPNENLFIVDVELQKWDVKALSKRRGARVLLPVGATIKNLRDIIGSDVPPSACILDSACEFGAEKPLEETDLVPRRVSVTEFNGRSSCYCHFTKQECVNNLRMIKAFSLRPEAQKSLDEAEESARGNEQAFRVGLSQLLSAEAYPAVFRHYGVEIEGLDAISGILTGMAIHDNRDVPYLEQQLEVEVLLRNKYAALSCTGALKMVCDTEKLPFPDVPHMVWQWLHGEGPSIRKSWTDL